MNHTVEQMKQLVSEGKVTLFTKNQIADANGDNDRLSSVSIKSADGEITPIDCDEALIFYGLKMELGPINDWGLNPHEKQIQVNTEDFRQIYQVFLLRRYFILSRKVKVNFIWFS